MILGNNLKDTLCKFMMNKLYKEIQAVIVVVKEEICEVL